MYSVTFGRGACIHADTATRASHSNFHIDDLCVCCVFGCVQSIIKTGPYFAIGQRKHIMPTRTECRMCDCALLKTVSIRPKDAALAQECINTLPIDIRIAKPIRQEDHRQWAQQKCQYLCSEMNITLSTIHYRRTTQTVKVILRTVCSTNPDRSTNSLESNDWQTPSTHPRHVSTLNFRWLARCVRPRFLSATMAYIQSHLMSTAQFV